ncbi:MAG TPA: signal recognition particle receptor subunit alpha, partial [Bacteroidales bacterium]
MALLGFLGRDKKESLNKGLEKTKESVFLKLSRAVAGKSKVDEDVLDKLEEVLISSDVGVETTLNIIKRIEARVAKDKYLNTSELNVILKQEIVELLENNQPVSDSDFSAPLKNTP